MSDYQSCPDPIALAAFVDGRLSADERREVVLHLDRCEACYETVLETVRFQSEEEPAGRVIGPRRLGATSRRPAWFWPAVAAASLLAAVLVFPVLRTNPDRVEVATVEPTNGVAALVAAVDAERLGDLGDSLWPVWPEEGGLAFSPISPDIASFRVGVRLVDLRFAAASRDARSVNRALGRLTRTLEAAGLGPTLERVEPELEAARAASSDPARLAERIERIERETVAGLDSAELGLGAWAEAGRVAAATGDRDYLGSAVFVGRGDAFASEDLAPDAARTVKAVRDAIRDRGDLEPAVVDEIERLLERLIASYRGE
jgi:hypothetical protein